MTGNTDMHLLVTDTLKKGNGSKKQSVSGVATIWLMQSWSTHAELLDIDGNWNTLSYTMIQSIPNMLNGWHVRWVCRPWMNWDIFSFQELCTDPCNMGSCIIMLKHEMMAVDEWHDNGPQDLITVSHCIQIAMDEMQLCLSSVAYNCLYHNPTATMGHSVHNADISKPLAPRRHTHGLQ